MYQKLVVVGHLGRDPEMRYTSEGKAVTNFSIATTRKWKNQDGNPGEETMWIRVSAWGRQAETCNEYLSKGRLVLVEGALRADPDTGGPRVWERSDGTPGASFEMTAHTVKFLGGRNDQVATAEDPPDMEDIPF